MAEAEGREVLRGAAGILSWRITAAGTRDNLSTMIEVFDGDRRVAWQGFAGESLPPGRLVNEWRGRAAGYPYFVIARTAPQVNRLIAVTDAGTRVELQLTDVDPSLSLRFSGGPLPAGEQPISLLFGTHDSQGLSAVTARVADRPPGGGASGWQPGSRARR